MSQGAEIFGKVIPEVIKMIKMKGHDIQIMQQCLSNQKKSLVDFYDKNKIKNYIFEFEKDILKLLLSTNLAITRCGASSTAELTQTLTPFIAVPLPNSVDNHQYLNAKYYEDKGCCLILEQNNFNSASLFNLIMETIENKSKLQSLSENMEKNSNKKVYEDIEKEVKKIITMCPHCSVNLGIEYSKYSKINYKVYHHTQIIEKFIKNKDIEINKGNNDKVTFHDPCNL